MALYTKLDLFNDINVLVERLVVKRFVCVLTKVFVQVHPKTLFCVQTLTNVQVH
jgi:hypothetical protein